MLGHDSLQTLGGDVLLLGGANHISDLKPAGWPGLAHQRQLFCGLCEDAPKLLDPFLRLVAYCMKAYDLWIFLF